MVRSCVRTSAPSPRPYARSPPSIARIAEDMTSGFTVGLIDEPHRHATGLRRDGAGRAEEASCAGAAVAGGGPGGTGRAADGGAVAGQPAAGGSGNAAVVCVTVARRAGPRCRARRARWRLHDHSPG